MIKAGAMQPFILFLSPRRYSKLVAVHERTGVMELNRIKSMVRDVVQLQQLSDNVALLVSANSYMLDVVVGADTVMDYLGSEDGVHIFRVWETIALRIKYPKAIMILKQE